MAFDYDLIVLQRLLVAHFDLDELKTLCFDVHVDFDELAGETKSAKARELVKHCYRHGLLDKLHEAGQRQRPGADWSAVIGHENDEELPDQWAEPLQRLYGLARAFNRNRHQPYSDRRTVEGDEIAFRMREVAPFVFDQFDVRAWLNSPNIGKRLAAIKYLDWLQDFEYLDDLLKKLLSEGPFVQLHVLIAIDAMLDQIEERKIGLIRTAMTAYPITLADPSREFWKRRIIERLSSR